MNTPSSITINGITLTGPQAPRQNEVLTADVLSFLATLHREFGPRIEALDAVDGASDEALGEAEEVAASWYALIDKQLSEPPCTFITPRGLARPEGRILCEGQPLSAGVVDFGLHIFRNARTLIADGRAPFISLLGLESEEELQLWQDLFIRAEELAGLPDGTIRAIHLGPGEPDQDDDEDGDASSAAVLTGASRRMSAAA
ncbi:hypothetical protein ACFP47_12375 [Nesterenkonia lacusekhoensis]|uniref:malate synthase n=1 Tax=Nesterenkonia lacusekhoensis TaxID=150832 RepID=A0ABS4SYN2_9MICC|nr:hypothetical protein [Nesterenkonia lacusekhoensis]MBP2317307.1 malate synthase [Nesterenkonia lacusekhoensis]